MSTTTTPVPEALVAPTFIATSIFDAKIDLSKKEGACLYRIGSEALPNNFSGHGKDICVFINALKNRAKKCNCWTKTVLNITIGNRALNLLKDSGCIPMDALKQLCGDHKNNSPITLAKERASIDSPMMFT
jgi:hypothetical protein